MPTILSYQTTEKLYESANSQVYRGYKISDNKSVILKILKPDYPPPENIARFKREYEILHRLNFKGTIRVFSLENDQNLWVMVLEDFQGQSLHNLLRTQGPLPIGDFLKIAIQITSILGQIHQHHIIHKDINPSNILIEPVTGQAKLIDFGISTVLSRENPSFRNTNLLEGTLAYMSPEQTGRMNRAIDYRTDFYSLGATFYELLSGQLPFPMQKAVEWIHSHIAKQVLSLTFIKPEIPKPLSEIVQKLMAKNAEDRYQSALGLKTDLEICLQQWEAQERIEAFPLAQTDVSDRFEILQKLYGREEQSATLMSAIERVSQGSSEMMLVAGYAGIGKSVLVHELYKPLTHQQGYFIAGKFDQFQRDIPYTSIVRAFQGLMHQLLSESEADLAKWRQKLRDALGINGQVVIDVVPELELIIGSQPRVPTLGSKEAQNRFNLVFQNFIKVFTQPEHPLVIFLDDLQWADGASLQFIEQVMTAGDIQHLFLIGAYRDNEVSPIHPLMLTLEAIKKANATVNQITLSPLDLQHVTQLISESFHCEPDLAEPLAELVQSKTDGNPFFVNEFLRALYVDALLDFDHQAGRWQWDLSSIQAQQVTDNVVELMVNRVQRLPSETLTTLKLAACVGNRFDLKQLAIISEQSPRATAAALGAALAEGFILPLTDNYSLVELGEEDWSTQWVVEYQFAHDRIQQALYSLIPETEQQAVHLRVGRLLQQNTPEEELEQRLFDIVNHLNQGRGQLTPPNERNELVQLNLQAGKKAKASAAYQPALNYLQVALELLEEDSWQQHYDLTLELHVEAAEAAYLNANLEEMERLVERVLQHAKTLLDKIRVYELKIQVDMSQFRMQMAIDTALNVLKQLGISLPSNPTPDMIWREQRELDLLMGDREIEDLAELPMMTDPHQFASIRVLLALTTPAFSVNFTLFVLTTSKMVKLFIQHGNSTSASAGYVCHALSCHARKDLDSGYRFGQLALRLLEQFEAKEWTAVVLNTFNCFVRHWKQPLRETLVSLQEGMNAGLETGDIEHGCFAALSYCSHRLYSGDNLKEVEQKHLRYIHLMSKFKQEYPLLVTQIGRQMALNLLGVSVDKCHLIGESFDESKTLPILIEANDATSLFYIYVTKAILSYLFKDYPQTLDNLGLGEPHKENASGIFVVALHNFYHSLSILALYPHNDCQETHCLKTIFSNQEQMKRWAYHAPANYQHKYELVEAEKARVLGNVVEAMALYDSAIRGAREQRYLHEEAIAYERAAEFYFELGREEIAQLYLIKARYGYERWGAVAKVKQLDAKYTQFFSLSRVIEPVNEPLASTTFISLLTTGVTNLLDWAGLMKTSQAISSEIVMEGFVEIMMTSIIRQVGAQKGFLIINQAGNWSIEAQFIMSPQQTMTQSSIPLYSAEELLSVATVNYVARTQTEIVFNNAAERVAFATDPYLVAAKPLSILCMPLLSQGQLTGILYLENNLTTEAFTPDKLEILKLLAPQAAISLDHAKRYSEVITSYEQFKQADQLKRELIVSITHEVSTLIKDTLNGIESLKREDVTDGLTHQQLTTLSKISSDGQRLEHLINELLEFFNND